MLNLISFAVAIALVHRLCTFQYSFKTSTFTVASAKSIKNELHASAKMNYMSVIHIQGRA